MLTAAITHWTVLLFSVIGTLHERRDAKQPVELWIPIMFLVISVVVVVTEFDKGDRSVTDILLLGQFSWSSVYLMFNYGIILVSIGDRLRLRRTLVARSKSNRD